MPISQQVNAMLHAWERFPPSDIRYGNAERDLDAALTSSDDAQGILAELNRCDPEYLLPVPLRMRAYQRAVTLLPTNKQILMEYLEYLKFVGGPDFLDEENRIRDLLKFS
jgi:hypothetical protein